MASSAIEVRRQINGGAVACSEAGADGGRAPEMACPCEQTSSGPGMATPTATDSMQGMKAAAAFAVGGQRQAEAEALLAGNPAETESVMSPPGPGASVNPRSCY